MADIPKISIIVPVYNSEKYIDRCINSLINQTLKDIEIICVDDYCNDNTFEILNNYSKQDNRIKVLRNDNNLGTLMSRKKAVLSSNSEYIMFSDADDYYELNAFEIAYNSIKQKNVDILMYSARPVYEVDNDFDEERKEWIIKKYNSEKEILLSKPERIVKSHSICEINTMIWLWNLIVDSDVCKKAYKNCEDLYLTLFEDAYACWLMHYYASSFDTIPDILHNWDITSEGASNKQKRSLEAFEHFCKHACICDNALMKFVENNNLIDVKNDFIKGIDTHKRIIVQRWYETITSDDSLSGLNIMFGLYNEEDIVSTIHERLANLEATVKLKTQANKELIKHNKELIKQIQDISSSTTLKIGRIMTYIPRLIKNVINKYIHSTNKISKR